MLKNKIVAVGLTGVLTMSAGLVACGGQPAASSSASSSEATASSSATEQAKEAAEAAKIIYWQGTTSDGQEAVYMNDDDSKTASLVIVKSDASDGQGWSGKTTVADDKITITDESTNKAVTLTVVEAAADGNSLKVNVEGYGDINMKPITQGEFNKAAEGYITTAAAEAAAEAADAISKTTMYWEGTLSDGSTVDYMDDAAAKEATLSVVKADMSDGNVWSGKVKVENGKSTITDNESKKTITFTVVSSDDKGTSLDIEGYGKVDLKPVTGGDVANQAEQLVNDLSKEAK